MVINKTWSMPNKETFSIKPIRELIDKYREEGMVIVDPFARNSDIGTITNDLDPETKAMYHKDATDFLCHLDDNIADMVLYDPPYSARQVSESYKRLGGSVNMQTTQSSYWARQKNEIARHAKANHGLCFPCFRKWKDVGGDLKLMDNPGDAKKEHVIHMSNILKGNCDIIKGRKLYVAFKKAINGGKKIVIKFDTDQPISMSTRVMNPSFGEIMDEYGKDIFQGNLKLVDVPKGVKDLIVNYIEKYRKL